MECNKKQELITEGQKSKVSSKNSLHSPIEKIDKSTSFENNVERTNSQNYIKNTYKSITNVSSKNRLHSPIEKVDKSTSFGNNFESTNSQNYIKNTSKSITKVLSRSNSHSPIEKMDKSTGFENNCGSINSQNYIKNSSFKKSLTFDEFVNSQISCRNSNTLDKISNDPNECLQKISKSQNDIKNSLIKTSQPVCNKNDSENEKDVFDSKSLSSLKQKYSSCKSSKTIDKVLNKSIECLQKINRSQSYNKNSSVRISQHTCNKKGSEYEKDVFDSKSLSSLKQKDSSCRSSKTLDKVSNNPNECFQKISKSQSYIKNSPDKISQPVCGNNDFEYEKDELDSKSLSSLKRKKSFLSPISPTNKVSSVSKTCVSNSKIKSQNEGDVCKPYKILSFHESASAKCQPSNDFNLLKDENLNECLLSCPKAAQSCNEKVSCSSKSSKGTINCKKTFTSSSQSSIKEEIINEYGKVCNFNTGQEDLTEFVNKISSTSCNLLDLDNNLKKLNSRSKIIPEDCTKIFDALIPKEHYDESVCKSNHSFINNRSKVVSEDCFQLKDCTKNSDALIPKENSDQSVCNSNQNFYILNKQKCCEIPCSNVCQMSARNHSNKSNSFKIDNKTDVTPNMIKNSLSKSKFSKLKDSMLGSIDFLRAPEICSVNKALGDNCLNKLTEETKFHSKINEVLSTDTNYGIEAIRSSIISGLGNEIINEDSVVSIVSSVKK